MSIWLEVFAGVGDKPAPPAVREERDEHELDQWAIAPPAPVADPEPDPEAAA
jgi:hypothetical protein